MLYSNIDFNVIYVDPSLEASGDGRTPGAALKDLPVTTEGFADNSCYLIRRTAETSACTIPAGTNNTLRNLLLLGMPNPNDAMYAFVPEEAKTAWGLDAAEYANIKSTNASGQFVMDGIRQFLLHRVYLFRDNINADRYIFAFNASDYTAVAALDHCKFGSRGIDLERDDYEGVPVTTSRLKAYLYCNCVHMLSIRDCVINFTVSGNTNDAHGIYCRTARFLQLEDVKIHAPMYYNSYEYRPLQVSDSSGDAVEAVVRNVEMKVYFNGTYEYVPQLFSLSNFQHAVVEHITVGMGGDKLGTARPANLRLNGRMISLSGVRECSVKNISVTLPQLWRLESSGQIVYVSAYWSTYLPGVSKEVKSISIILAQGEEGIGPCNTYAEIQNSSRGNYSALHLDFSNRETYSCWKMPQCDNIRVVHPRGRAFYAYNLRGTNIDLAGTGCFSQSLMDINNLDTWFPGHALWAGDGSTVRVRNLQINLENSAYIYSNDPAVSSTYSDRSFVVVDGCNAPLRPNLTDSSQSGYPYCAFVSNNEGEDGHFVHRSPHGVCDTWNVRREGGGAACLKLWNNTFNTTSTMTLGQKPFKGMMLTPNRTGRHILKLHVAWKGYPDASDLFRRFMVSATIGGAAFWSNLQGRWLDDSAAVWVNDSNLTQRVLEIPINIIEIAPIDIRMYFSWYSNAGFLYVDPAVELVPEADGE